jgi:hypothetical protein
MIMNTDPRRGLPNAAERSRTNVRLSEDAEKEPGLGESGKPASAKPIKGSRPAEQSVKPRQ